MWTFAKSHCTLRHFGEATYPVHFNWHQILDDCTCSNFYRWLFRSCLVCGFWISATESVGLKLRVLVRLNGRQVIQKTMHNLYLSLPIYFCIWSVPLPDGTNVVLSYYVTWTDQFLGTVAYYTMLCTISLFIIGICMFIGGMVKDLELTLAELNTNSDTIANQSSTEIAFHNQIVE